MSHLLCDPILNWLGDLRLEHLAIGGVVEAILLPRNARHVVGRQFVPRQRQGAVAVQIPESMVGLGLEH